MADEGKPAMSDGVFDIIDGKTFVRTDNVGCPLCGTERKSRPIDALFGMKAYVAVCDPCRIAFQTPRPSPEATLAYMNWRWNSADAYVSDVSSQRARGREQLEMIGQYMQKPGTLLDFGAGAGSFVRVARDAGWDAIGVERSDTARSKAKSVYDVSLLEELPDIEYDVITLWDVIEHLRDPEAMLRMLRKNLKPGGLIFVETGNWENWQRVVNGDKWHVYLLDHHFYFSPSSLSRLVANAGYESFSVLDVNRITPGGWGSFRKMPRYTAQSWAGWLRAKQKWPGHGNISTLVAVAQKPAY
jgi:SAM-dependent methyltransferase